MSDLGVLAALILGYALVSRRLERSAVTAPMVFVAGGIVLGPSVLGAVSFDLGNEIILVIAEVTLVLVLFTDAARVRPARLARTAGDPVRLLTVAMPLTIAAGSAVALVLLGDLAPWEAAIVGAVLAPTDAALGALVITSPTVPARIRRAINVESGLNDGLAVPFLTAFIAAASVEEGAAAGFWVRFAIEQIGLGTLAGIVVGLAGGLALSRLRTAGWISDTFIQLGMLSLAVLAWSGAEAIDGNGFIASFVAGLTAGAVSGAFEQHLLSFAEDEGQLFELATFFIFGVAIAGPALDRIDWRAGLYALASLTVVRMLPVALALTRTGLRRASILFVGWFGPRGLASIVLVLIVLEETQLDGRERIGDVVTATVLLSVLAHGITAAPLTRAYARYLEGLAEEAPESMPVVEVAPGLPMRDVRGRSPEPGNDGQRPP